MRLSTKNKQYMWYSKFSKATENYKRDEEGNIIYIEIDGEKVPVSLGTIEPHYERPVKFTACIGSELNELQVRSYGVDQSGIYSTIVVPKKYVDVEANTLIWRENEIKWEDEENGIPLASSADYTVKGLMTEGLQDNQYLLQRNSSEE